MQIKFNIGRIKVSTESVAKLSEETIVKDGVTTDITTKKALPVYVELNDIGYEVTDVKMADIGDLVKGLAVATKDLVTAEIAERKAIQEQNRAEAIARREQKQQEHEEYLRLKEEAKREFEERRAEIAKGYAETAKELGKVNEEINKVLSV